jgi:hypothetical protein
VTRRVALAVAAWLLLVSPARAQIMPPTGQTITVIDSGAACSVARACATWSIGSAPTVALQVTGTFTGTLTFEGSADNLTWFTIALVNLATGGLATTTATTGQFTLVNTGIVGLRARATAAVTGGANLTLTRGTAMSASKAPAPAGGAIAGTTGVFSGNLSPQTQVLCADGTALLPCYSFASEPTLGFWRSSAGNVTLQGTLNVTSGMRGGATSFIGWTSRAAFSSPGVSAVNVVDATGVFGAQFNVGALPTIASGFGTSPSVTAGSTPLAGSVNVGTGGVATTGLINFGGTAFPSAPFCLVQAQGNYIVRPVTSATQLQINSNSAFAASDIVSWICISSK